MKRVTVQVPGRVVTVVGLNVKVSSVKRVMYRYLDESLRWLVANGRKEAAVRVLERAARVNRKDLTAVLKTLQDGDELEGSEHTSGSHRQTLIPTALKRTYHVSFSNAVFDN